MKELALNNCRLDGRYDIQSLLGRGSYAEIYVARDTLASPHSPHHLVAIKALNVFLQNDLDSDLERTLVENFQNEAIALDRVRHPNIISRLGHGTARDLRGTVFHYIVLEYLSGGDLARECRKKSLTLDRALNYLEQVCAGLTHAHKHGIIHRDIKPQNLLLTEDKLTVKIADFGVARISQTDSPITRVGTDIYAPPEHSPAMAGTTGVLTFSQLTPAADIYSLAKSAYVLITSESPRFFANQPITELPFAVREEDWAPDLLEILNKATKTNPLERYQNINDFWADLSKLERFNDKSETTAILNRNSSDVPKSQVSKGYSPLAPQRPEFNTSRDFKIKSRENLLKDPSLVIRLGDSAPNIIPAPMPQPEITEDSAPQILLDPPPSQRKSNGMRRFAFLAIFLVIFAGSLFATYNYLRGRSIFSGYSNSVFDSADAVALTDINLRPEPNLNNERIGIVTKNSRLKIIGSQDNWYQVDIIEHGGQKRSDWAERGWISGKTRSGDDTIKISR